MNTMHIVAMCHCGTSLEIAVCNDLFIDFK